MEILYLIPARGGSKGLPGKNIKLLNGKPLICYTIDAAREVSEDANICVSTDDIKIAEVAEAYGVKVPFLRPSELATDYSTSEQVILHALQHYADKKRDFEYVVLLQPTSPLRTGQHLKEALALIETDTEMIVSVKVTDSNPYYVLFEEDPTGQLQKTKEGRFTRRQDCPVIYELNGSIYIIRVDKLIKGGLANLRKKKYLMDKMSSIDIDDIIDFKLVELLISKSSG
ncbi:acylneuraminate cytidylyltransferase family protein [Pontibacter anaerobius]|uniref:Acylneuraminate cytidylyltransferase family protein n=1 Tax=Pontibacter anaerobius TaxID=2993940 RepID=A0ABT3REV8_9BACT|nr:acylneuraminate cytidylyltransferase family protein [Pontibacter anaerobius]MCX2739971.1 acylneuraminate cytidylyltransferase family protein [Pontibacter anaerobius]